MDYVVDFSELLSRARWEWLQIEVSGLCNAACCYCPLNCYRPAWKPGLMKEAIFERLVPEFRHANLVFLQGWGEPLLHPRFWDMAARVKSSGTQLGFTTNGTCLDGTNLTRLLDTPIDILAVSIAGTTAATSDRRRVGNDFSRLAACLTELSRMKKMPNAAGPRVHIAYMLLASNWREVESLPTLAQNWGASQVVVNNLSFVCSSDLEKESLFRRPDLWDAARAALEDAKQRAIGLGIEFYYYRPDEQEPRPVCTENVLHSCFVSHSGDVSPCVLTNLSMRGTDAGCHLFRGHAYPLEHLVFGSVRNQSLREVWHSASAQAFRSAFEQRMKHHRELSDVPEPCRHCYKLFEGAT